MSKAFEDWRALGFGLWGFWLAVMLNDPGSSKFSWQVEIANEKIEDKKNLPMLIAEGGKRSSRVFEEELLASIHQEVEKRGKIYYKTCC